MNIFLNQQGLEHCVQHSQPGRTCPQPAIIELEQLAVQHHPGGSGLVADTDKFYTTLANWKAGTVAKYAANGTPLLCCSQRFSETPVVIRKPNALQRKSKFSLGCCICCQKRKKKPEARRVVGLTRLVWLPGIRFWWHPPGSATTGAVPFVLHERACQSVPRHTGHEHLVAG